MNRRGLLASLFATALAPAIPPLRLGAEATPILAVTTGYRRYAGYEMFNITRDDIIAAAEFDWKQAARAVTISVMDDTPKWVTIPL